MKAIGQGSETTLVAGWGLCRRRRSAHQPLCGQDHGLVQEEGGQGLCTPRGSRRQVGAEDLQVSLSKTRIYERLAGFETVPGLMLSKWGKAVMVSVNFARW